MPPRTSEGVETSVITLRAWQGTAGSSYGTGNNNTPAIRYGTNDLSAGASTGFRINSPFAPNNSSGAVVFSGTVTAGGVLSSTIRVTIDTLPPAVTIKAIGGADRWVSSQANDNTVVGTGEANRLVQIRFGNTVLGTTTAGANGAFSYSLTTANLSTIGQGSNKSITARQTDANGNVGTSSAFVFSVDTFAPTITATITSVTGDAGSSQGVINRLGSTDNQTPTLTGIYNGNLGTGESVQIFNGATLLGRATITRTRQRTWRFTPATLAADRYSFVAQVADQAGNLGTTVTNSTYTITITGGVAAPVVSAIALSAATGAQNNWLNAGDVITATVTMSAAVTVTGTPSLQLNINGSTELANYSSGSGSTSLLFSYTSQSGQNDGNGISINADSLSLNGDKIVASSGGTAATLTHVAVTDNASYRVDTTAPVFSSGTSAAVNESVAAGSVVYTATTQTDMRWTGFSGQGPSLTSEAGHRP